MIAYPAPKLVVPSESATVVQAYEGSVRAAIYSGPGEVRLVEMPDPVAREGELLLDVATFGKLHGRTAE